ncbi:MAG: hypothetical protein KBT30_00390, partial [Clostridiales bacterium]|nr:hypothetical protein [Candidatus Apopatousia equi]
MFKDLLNKVIEVNVVLASQSSNSPVAPSIPEKYTGVLLDYNDEFIKIKIGKLRKNENTDVIMY